MRHSFRFLHAADLHLDSPLRGLSRYEGLSVDEIRGATRRVLEALVSFAIAEYVDFVVIAGDICDGRWQDMGTGLFFTAAMAKLNTANIPVYLLKGNHDADSKLPQRLPLPLLSGSLVPEMQKRFCLKTMRSHCTARVLQVAMCLKT